MKIYGLYHLIASHMFEGIFISHIILQIVKVSRNTRLTAVSMSSAYSMNVNVSQIYIFTLPSVDFPGLSHLLS